MRLLLSPATAAALLLLLLASQPLSCSACQSPFTIINGHCVFIDNTAMSWCDAAARCLQIGGELLINIGVMRAVRPTLTTYGVWIGATDLLQERGTSRSGWRLTNGSLLDASSSDWKSGFPDSGAANDDFIEMRPEGFHDLRFHHSRRAACQPITTPNSGIFKQTDFLKLGKISPNYCLTMETVKVQLECIARCTSRWQCRAALHNSVQQLCRMLDFTDASVGDVIEKSSEWKKFVKVY